MLKKLVEGAQVKPVEVSRDITICIDWLGRSAQAQKTESAVHRMNNEDKLRFIQGLIAVRQAAHGPDQKKVDEARAELVDLFGEEILTHEFLRTDGGHIFTLTADGHQFRGWYAPFGRVSHGHFDSCGRGCFFSASCEDGHTLSRFAAEVVGNRLKWDSAYGFGTIWMSFG